MLPEAQCEQGQIRDIRFGGHTPESEVDPDRFTQKPTTVWYIDIEESG